MATKKTNAGQVAASALAQIAALSPDAQLPPMDAATFLGVSTAQLERMRGSNIGPRFTMEKVDSADLVQYKKQDLADWLAANKSGRPVVKAQSKK